MSENGNFTFQHDRHVQALELFRDRLIPSNRLKQFVATMCRSYGSHPSPFFLRRKKRKIYGHNVGYLTFNIHRCVLLNSETCSYRCFAVYE